MYEYIPCKDGRIVDGFNLPTCKTQAIPLGCAPAGRKYFSNFFYWRGVVGIRDMESLSNDYDAAEVSVELR